MKHQSATAAWAAVTGQLRVTSNRGASDEGHALVKDKEIALVKGGKDIQDRVAVKEGRARGVPKIRCARGDGLETLDRFGGEDTTRGNNNRDEFTILLHAEVGVLAVFFLVVL